MSHDIYSDEYQHFLRDQEINRQELLAELEWLKQNPDPFKEVPNK